MADSRARRDNKPTPVEVVRLLDAANATARDAAWSAFAQRFSRLILHTARQHASGYDDAMDRYAYVLERLKEDDSARLRRFSSRGSGQFSTWLVVVVRRLCGDYHRRRYGRLRAGEGEQGTKARERHEARRRLLDMVVDNEALELLSAPGQENPERSLRASELSSALERTLSSLEDRDRLILQLRFEEGLTAREVAQFLRMKSQFHVYRRIKALLAHVRELLEAEGIHGSRP